MNVEDALAQLQSRIEELEVARTAVVQALGGEVEGLPTGKHNLLQRVRELREIESEYKAGRTLEAIAKFCDMPDAELRDELGMPPIEQENEQLRRVADRLISALKGLNLDDAMTYEGNLDAHAYFSVDALNEARAALAEAEGL